MRQQLVVFAFFVNSKKKVSFVLFTYAPLLPHCTYTFVCSFTHDFEETRSSEKSKVKNRFSYHVKLESFLKKMLNWNPVSVSLYIQDDIQMILSLMLLGLTFTSSWNVFLNFSCLLLSLLTTSLENARSLFYDRKYVATNTLSFLYIKL